MDDLAAIYDRMRVLVRLLERQVAAPAELAFTCVPVACGADVLSQQPLEPPSGRRVVGLAAQWNAPAPPRSVQLFAGAGRLAAPALLFLPGGPDRWIVPYQAVPAVALRDGLAVTVVGGEQDGTLSLYLAIAPR